MSSGRGIFLSAILTIGVFSILSVLGISWLLEPDTHSSTQPSVSLRVNPTSTPALDIALATPPSQGKDEKLTKDTENVIGGG